MSPHRVGVRFRPTTRCVSFGFALVAAVGGALGLLGWALGSDGLRSVGPGVEPMRPPAALAALLLGAALAHRPDTVGRPGRLATAAASAVIAGGLLVVAVGLFASQPTRMAPIAAVCLVAVGAGLVLRRLAHPGWAHLCGVACSLAGWILLSAHVYGVAPFAGAASSSFPSFQTATAIGALGLALIWSTPDFGIPGMAQRSHMAGLITRVGVPVLVAAPMLVGWIVLQALREHWYSPGFAVALMSILGGIVGGVALWFTLQSIVRLDEARSRTLGRLADVNERLEHDVAERTASLETQLAIRLASLEALEQGVTLSSPDGEVLLMNRAARELLGYDPDELTEVYRSGRSAAFNPDGSPLAAQERPVAKTTVTGEPVAAQVVRIAGEGGRSLDLRVCTQPVWASDGQLFGVVTAFSEISAELEAQRAADQHLAALTELNSRMEQAVRMKERFLSMVTHDMRSPIATIMGLGELLSRADMHVPEERRAAHLRSIMRQGQRLELLVQDLLSTSVVDGGAISFDPQALHLAPMVRQVSVDARIAEDVDVQVPADVVVFADPLRLAQILANLLLNATIHGRPPIVVSACGDGLDVVVRISDRGDGVNPAFAPHLFDTFTTAPRPDRAGKAGSGLGLAIVRGLAELQGGEVWYEPNEAGGACFVLRLPSGLAADSPDAVSVA